MPVSAVAVNRQGRPYQTHAAEERHFAHKRGQMASSDHQFFFFFGGGDCRRHLRVWGSEGGEKKKCRMTQRQKCVYPPVIFRWKQNCKRQTRISLCLSLADRNRVRSLAGVQADLVAPCKYLTLGGNVDHCTGLHGYCKPRRVFLTVRRELVEQLAEKLSLFLGPWWRRGPDKATGRHIQPNSWTLLCAWKLSKCVNLRLSVIVINKYIHNCYMTDDDSRKSAVFELCKLCWNQLLLTSSSCGLMELSV